MGKKAVGMKAVEVLKLVDLKGVLHEGTTIMLHMGRSVDEEFLAVLQILKHLEVPQYKEFLKEHLSELAAMGESVQYQDPLGQALKGAKDFFMGLPELPESLADFLAR